MARVDVPVVIDKAPVPEKFAPVTRSFAAILISFAVMATFTIDDTVLPNKTVPVPALIVTEFVPPSTPPLKGAPNVISLLLLDVLIVVVPVKVMKVVFPPILIGPPEVIVPPKVSPFCVVAVKPFPKVHEEVVLESLNVSVFKKLTAFATEFVAPKNAIE